jgi:hypothetical protein
MIRPGNEDQKKELDAAFIQLRDTVTNQSWQYSNNFSMFAKHRNIFPLFSSLNSEALGKGWEAEQRVYYFEWKNE